MGQKVPGKVVIHCRHSCNGPVEIETMNRIRPMVLKDETGDVGCMHNNALYQSASGIEYTIQAGGVYSIQKGMFSLIALPNTNPSGRQKI